MSGRIVEHHASTSCFLIRASSRSRFHLLRLRDQLRWRFWTKAAEVKQRSAEDKGWILKQGLILRKIYYYNRTFPLPSIMIVSSPS